MGDNPKNAFVAKYKSKAGATKKTVDANKLIQDIESGETDIAVLKTTKNDVTVTQDGNWVEEEDKGGIFFNQDTSSAGQAQKQVKKKAAPVTSVATWADAQKTKDEETPAPQPQKQQEEEHVVQPKKKMLNLPGKGGTQPKRTGIVIDESDFLALGETPKELPQKTVEKTVNVDRTPEKKAGGGPPRFVNAKSVNNNVQTQLTEPTLKTTPAEKTTAPATTTTTTTPLFTKSALPQQTQTQAQAEADSKFKFSAEKPRFVSAQKPELKVKEIVKTEVELAREQKEREIEEKLAKEREELRKKQDEIKKKDGPRFKKAEGEKDKEATETKPEVKAEIKPEPTTTTTEQPTAEGEKPKFRGFVNAKKKDTPNPVPEESKTEEKNGAHADENGTHDDFINVEAKLVKKNGKPKRTDENGDHEKHEKGEKKERKPKKKPEETPTTTTIVQPEDKKEEPKVVPAHEVIEVATNVTAVSWDQGILKKVSKKK